MTFRLFGRPVRRAGAGAVALGLVALGAIALPVASADAAPGDTDQLAVFSATASASPYGVLSRVPAETSGGALFSGTRIDLGKARALAAGFTLGELGDLFVVSSAPPGTITSMPTVITAQDPPQELSPNEAEFAGGRSGGGGAGEARNFTLRARANDAPAATADAAGQAVSSASYSSGFSTSNSESRVLEDGTVVTKAVTSVQDILLGPPGAQLSVASAASRATVTIAPGREPVTELQTRMSGALLAGIPVTFDENGISVDDQIALPASALAGFSAALATLAEQGITFMPAPRTVATSEDGASVAGGALVYRYRVPDAIPRPSDIGTDQTFTVASVAATATSRVRTAPDAPPPVAGEGPADAGTDTAAGGATGSAPGSRSAATTAPTAPALSPIPAGEPGTVPFIAAPDATANLAATDGEFLLPARVADLVPQQTRDAYRFVLLAALLALVGVFLIVRKRPI